METWQLALRARCHVSIRQSPSLCNAILNTCQMLSRFYIIPSDVNKSQTQILGFVCVIVLKKGNPSHNKIWLCLNVTIWYSQICYCCDSYFQNIWKNCTYSHFFNHQSLIQLVSSKSIGLLVLLAFKATITLKHSDGMGFHRAGGDLIFQFCIRASHFRCIVGAQPEIQCLTVRTTWLVWG